MGPDRLIIPFTLWKEYVEWQRRENIRKFNEMQRKLRDDCIRFYQKIYDDCKKAWECIRESDPEEYKRQIEKCEEEWKKHKNNCLDQYPDINDDPGPLPDEA